MTLVKQLEKNREILKMIKSNNHSLKESFIKEATEKIKHFEAKVKDVIFSDYLSNKYLPDYITHAIEVVIEMDKNEFRFYKLFRDDDSSIEFFLEETFFVTIESGSFIVNNFHSLRELEDEGFGSNLNDLYPDNADVKFEILNDITDLLSSALAHTLSNASLGLYDLNLYFLSLIVEKIKNEIPSEFTRKIEIQNSLTSELSLIAGKKSRGLQVNNNELYRYLIAE